MISRLEVLPGAGTVARFDEIAVWAGAGASTELLTFLVQSARNLGALPDGGQRMAAHLAGVLHQRNPEPNTPFVTVGPGFGAPVALLHGPVQMWDGGRWLRPEAATGWLVMEVPDVSTVLVTPNDTPAPASANSVLDLLAGVVPGGGLAVVLSAAPVPDGEGAGDIVAESVPAEAEPAETTGPGPAASESGPAPTPQPTPEAEVVPETAAEDAPAPTPTGPLPPTAATPADPPADPPPVPAPPADPPPTVAAADPPPTDAPPNPALHTVDLRTVPVESRRALPLGGPGESAAAGGDMVDGVRCQSGHFNHAGASACLRCGLPLDPVRGRGLGPRPGLGVLVGTDGSLWRADGGYLVGTAPSDDPAVASGELRALAVPEDGQVEGAHAELRLTGWTLSVVDRNTSSGTFILPAGASDWERVAPEQPIDVRPGTHVAVGSTVFTFTSPWPL